MAIFTGTAGADTIIGTAGSDTIRGLAGDDILDGQAGNDIIDGGDGDDVVDGGDGDDTILIGLGADVMNGGAGDDVFTANAVQVSSPAPVAIGEINGGIGRDLLDLSAVWPSGLTTVTGPSGRSLGVYIGSQKYSIREIEEIRLGSNDDLVFLDSSLVSGLTLRTGGGRDTVQISGVSGTQTQPVAVYTEGGDDEVFISGAFGTTAQFIVDGGVGTNLLKTNIQFTVDLAAGTAQSGGAQYVITAFQNVMVAAHFGYLSTVRGDSGANIFSVNPLFNDGSVGVVFDGRGGNDTLSGSAGNDTLIAGPGLDTLLGGTGNDGLFFGAFFDRFDTVDGGAGTFDQVGLQGDYSAGVTFGANSAIGVEQFVLLPGNDTRFGAPGNESFSYNIITGDAAIGAGLQLVFQANTLRAGESFTLDASGELDGLVFTYAGQGADLITGSQTGDAFFFGTGRFNAGDVVNGQGGIDQIGLQGSYSGANAIVFGAGQILNVEAIVLLTNTDTRFGTGNGTPYSYDLTTNDGNVAAGQRLAIQANTLASNEVLRFNGAAETDGSFSIFSGNGDDVIIGSHNDDTISGRSGADALTGGGGNDIFLYTNVTDSTAAARDMITDSAAGDRIDLSRIDAVTGGGDDAFTLIGSEAFSNVAGQLRVSNTSGNIFAVEGDVNGDSIADFSILLTNIDNRPITVSDFVL